MVSFLDVDAPFSSAMSSIPNDSQFQNTSGLDSTSVFLNFADIGMDLSIHVMSSGTDIHDMGFIVRPALRKDWELNRNAESLKSILTAAHSLTSRFDEEVKVIRSWNQAVKTQQ